MALFPEVEGIIEFAWYPYGFERQSGAFSTKFEDGSKNVRSGFSEQRRRGRLSCFNLPKLDKERISAFFREIEGGGNIFQIVDRVNAIVPPYFAPALSLTAGGAFGSRTYFVVTTHSDVDRTKETTESIEDSLLIPAGQLLTVKMPNLPPGAVRSNVYVGTASGVLYYAGGTPVSLDSWVQGFGSTNVNSDSGIGTDILFVASTANMNVYDPIIVDSGGAREERHIIKALLTGPTRIQIEGTLGFTHTLGDADPVAVVILDTNFGTFPSDNNMTDEEFDVALEEGSEWDPKLTSAGVWEGSVVVEEQLP